MEDVHGAIQRRLGSAADLVPGKQRCVGVEGGVLDALRGGGPAELLEALDESEPEPLELHASGGSAAEQRIGEEIERGGQSCGPGPGLRRAPPRAGGGPRRWRPAGGCRRTSDRPAAPRWSRRWPAPGRRGRPPASGCPAPARLSSRSARRRTPAASAGLQHQPLSLARDRRELERPPDHPAILGLQRRIARGLDEQRLGLVEEVVSRGSGYGPLFAERFCPASGSSR